jgi:hypothetical protein
MIRFSNFVLRTRSPINYGVAFSCSWRSHTFVVVATTVGSITLKNERWSTEERLNDFCNKTLKLQEHL